MNKLILSITIILATGFSHVLNAEEFIWAPEYAAGSNFPDFSLVDQNGNLHTNETVAEENGYLILFNRSVVW